MIDITGLREDKRPQSSTIVHALLDRLEAAERERDDLRAKLEATESDAAHQKALADSALRVAEGWEEKCNALRAKVEAMEKQEPAWFIDERGEPKRYHKRMADYCKCGGLDLLYALPGAKGK